MRTLALCCVFAGCASSAARLETTDTQSAELVAAVDRPEEMESARTFAPGDVLEGNLGVDEDEAWYRFTARHGEWLGTASAVQCAGAGCGGEVAIAMLDARGGRVGQHTAPAAESPGWNHTTRQLEVPEDGVYFLRLRCPACDGAVRFRIETSQRGRSRRDARRPTRVAGPAVQGSPNFESATDFEPGAELIGEVDEQHHPHFRVALRHGDALRFVSYAQCTTASPCTTSFVLHVLDEQGGRLHQLIGSAATAPEHQRGESTFRARHDGTFVVRLACHGGCASGAVRLRVLTERVVR